MYLNFILLLKVSGCSCKICSLKTARFKNHFERYLTLTGDKIICAEGHYVYNVVKRELIYKSPRF